MRKLLTLVALLCAAGAGRAGDKEIIERLIAQGTLVGQITLDGGLAVCLEAHNLDAGLAELCELRSLRGVSLLSHPGLTDNQVQRVCSLPGLRSLIFLDCSITDARLKIVARVRGLESLWLSGTAITDAGLAELSGLRDLESLSLPSASVTDAGLRHLEGIRGLTQLGLLGCAKITDGGLRHREGMKKLRSLDLRGCPRITAEGVARLQKALSDCKIIR
jgi:internalin A